MLSIFQFKNQRELPNSICWAYYSDSSILYILQVIMYTLGNNLIRSSDLHTHNIRHVTKFSLPVYGFALFEEKPSYMGVKLFNILPDDTRSQESTLSCKNRLRRWLISHSFYTIEVFQLDKSMEYSFIT